jgi:hypothetical protein
MRYILILMLMILSSCKTQKPVINVPVSNTINYEEYEKDFLDWVMKLPEPNRTILLKEYIYNKSEFDSMNRKNF